MTVHRLRPRHEQADRVRPAPNGAPLAALTTERARELALPFDVTRTGSQARRAARRVPASERVTTGRKTALFEREFPAHMPYLRRAAVIPPGGPPGADALFSPPPLSLPPHPNLTERAVARIGEEPARPVPRRPAGRGTLLSRTPRPRAAWARRYAEGL